MGGGEGVGLLSFTVAHDGIVRIGLFGFLLEAMTYVLSSTQLMSITYRNKKINGATIFDTTTNMYKSIPNIKHKLMIDRLNHEWHFVIIDPNRRKQ